MPGLVGLAKVPIAFNWYRSFIQFMLDNQWYEWFADLIMVCELLVGIALILGVFTGIAAFTGSFMNWNFITGTEGAFWPVTADRPA